MKINDALGSMYLDVVFSGIQILVCPFIIEEMLSISDNKSLIITAVESLYMHLIFD